MPLVYSLDRMEKAGIRVDRESLSDYADSLKIQIDAITEEIYELAGRRGELSFGTFQQAKEGPLSICPDLKRLSELTDGAFRERISFSEGIRELIKYNETIL